VTTTAASSTTKPLVSAICQQPIATDQRQRYNSGLRTRACFRSSFDICWLRGLLVSAVEHPARRREPTSDVSSGESWCQEGGRGSWASCTRVTTSTAALSAMSP
jgi:hypothetical protein